MALTKVEIAETALALAKPGGQKALAALQSKVTRETRIQARFRKQFIEGSSEIVLDEDLTSLQWRILDYLVEKEWIENPRELLGTALASAKVANGKQCRQAFVGGNGKEKNVAALRSKFTEVEQWLCHQVAVEGEIGQPFEIDDFTALVGRSFRQGAGQELIGFLCGLKANHKRRMKDLEKSRLEGPVEAQDFHSATLVMSLMWVFPTIPMWLLPCGAIASVVHDVLKEERPQEPTTIDRAIRRASLVRLPADVYKKFFSESVDKQGKALHAEIKRETAFDLSKCFGGRDKGT